jgi:hypothetical protein
MSPDELATGVKPDLSTWIAAPGQLMALHEDGKKASACVRTARLGIFIRPSGGGYLVRDVSTWRSFVTYHAKPVSSSVNGIAAQAIAVSHALNTPAVRGQVGFNGEVTQSVQRLVGHSGLWSDAEPNAVALLDPITGLAVRLVHVNVDGTLALLPAHFDSPAAAPSADALPAHSGSCPHCRHRALRRLLQNPGKAPHRPRSRSRSR